MLKEGNNSFTLFFLGTVVTFGAGAVFYGLRQKGGTARAPLQYKEVAMDSITGTSISELGAALNVMEDSLNAGDMAKLELATYSLPPSDELDVMWAEMIASGFHISKPIARVVDEIPVTSMVLTKGSPAWAALIPLIVPVAVVGLIAFGIAKIETISRALFPLVLTAGTLTVIALGLMRQPAARAAEAAAKKYLK